LDDEDFGERFDAEDFDANFIDADRSASGASVKRLSST